LAKISLMKVIASVIKLSAMVVAGSMSVHAIKGEPMPLNLNGLTSHVGQIAGASAPDLNPQHYASMVGSDLGNMVKSARR